MIKYYSFFAKWRKKDVEFLNSLGLNKTIKENYDGFWVEEDDRYYKIIEHYSKKDSLFNKTKPQEYKSRHTGCFFSKEEIDSARYCILTRVGDPKGYPQPKDTYQEEVFNFGDCSHTRINKIQVAPFRIKKPRWAKGQVNFSLNWEWDFMFFKKDFYQEVLAPLGLQSKEVLQHSTGQPLEDTIQLDIPVAKSKILIEGSAYDIYEPRCGKKQYARQTLDFFPPFEKEFNFHICYTQEEFDGGFKMIIASKELCELLIKHKVIKFAYKSFNTYEKQVKAALIKLNRRRNANSQ